LASNFLKIKDEYVKNLLTIAQKITCDTHVGAHVELADHILSFMGSELDLLQFFQAAWFATKCAKDNLEDISKMTVVVGDELFEIDLKFPKLFEIFPSTEKAENMGLLDRGKLQRAFVLTNEEAEKYPKTKQWEGHEEHELELKERFFGWVEDYWCEECDAFGSGWCYMCQECGVVIHPEHLKE